MAGNDALVILAQLLQLPDAEGSKANVIAIMAAADPPLDATAFVLGEPTERWTEVMGQSMNAWGSVPTAATRALFLRLSTDPGDVADDGTPDQSADQTPRPGMLSAVGAGWYGTIREEELFATGSVIFTNNSGSPINAPPGAIVFERNFAGPDGANPTYHSTGTVTVNPGLSVTVAIQADQLGTYASAPSGTIDHVVTQTYGSTNTVTQPSGINGRDREARSAYIERCLEAPDSNAPGGPTNAYKRAATTARDGSGLLNYSTGTPVGILGAQVLPDSSTGTVTGYLYGPSGPVGSATDISTANANIIGIATGLLTDPVGVLPDTVAILPNAADPVTGVGFSDCTATTIAIAFTARIPASKVPGGAAPGSYVYPGTGNVAPVFTSIGLALSSYLPGLGPGGLDQSAGAGFVYTGDIQDTIKEAVTGLYGVAVSTPATSTTPIAIGHIATQGSLAGSSITVVPG